MFAKWLASVEDDLPNPSYRPIGCQRRQAQNVGLKMVFMVARNVEGTLDNPNGITRNL